MLGERLRRLRQQERLTQEKLGKILNVQKTTVSLYESDQSNPSDAIKVRIAQYFNISLDYLLGIIDEPMPAYHEDAFLKFPINMTKESKSLLREYAHSVSLNDNYETSKE
ncbi:MAG: helix-turn-helix transcriptional regulator [Defluviitaleaceae bacterium]|nr:helix-turn-helix transcriptional regulator [Defluviitaleaceae bacterium]